MKGVIDTLKFTDSNGEKYNLYPRTLIECISNQNGDSLEDTLKNFIADNLPDGVTGGIVGEAGDGILYVDYESMEETDNYVPVDADSLGGKEASEFITKDGGTIDGSLVVKTGMAIGNTIRYFKDDTTYGRMGYSDVNTPVHISTSSERYPLLHSGNYSEYALPITGGTMTGVVNLGGGLGFIHSYSNKTEFEVRNTAEESGGKRRFTMWNKNVKADVKDAVQLCQRSDDDSSWTYYNILHSGNYSDYALPITGGTVTGLLKTDYNMPVTLELNSQGYNQNLIKFSDSNGALGSIGFNGVDNPSVYFTNQTKQSLLHTGNKPNGSYSGTGVDKSVKTGGTGQALIIRYTYNSTDIMAIVTRGGAIYKSGTTVQGISGTSVTFLDGTLGLLGSNVLNQSGVTYYYTVL